MLAEETTGQSVSSKKLYNDGTEQLRTGKLQEAEASLEGAVATQKVPIQPSALYNLGEVRFKQGSEELNKALPARAMEPMAEQASGNADSAIRSADSAMADGELDSMVAAYLQGKGAIKDLKAATAAVKKALETSGSVLAKWRRAAGDFKSAYELNAADADAQVNGQLMDRHISKLVDQQKMMMLAMQGMQGKRDELGQKLKALKKKMPQNPGGPMKGKGDDDDDEDEDKPGKGLDDAKEEAGPKNGHEMLLTQEEAMRLLGLLKLDGNRKLPLGGTDEGKPKDHKGRDW